jgi:branched-chain amino acid transport system permease protein
MIVGGLGNVRGAIVGGILIGFIEVMSIQYLGSEYREISVFALIFVTLVILPRGIMGVIQQEKGRV